MAKKIKIGYDEAAGALNSGTLPDELSDACLAMNLEVAECKITRVGGSGWVLTTADGTQVKLAHKGKHLRYSVSRK
jgi:hypothetical protein